MTSSRSLLLRRRQLLNLSSWYKILAPLGLSIGTLTLLAQTADETASGRAVAAIDMEYAKTALQKGMPVASADYFAEDGIAFAPFPVNGKKYWASRTDFSGTLIWQPIFAAAARSADMAYTTGPWELKKTGEQVSVAFGQYLTIWKKKPGKIWKIALDVGTENAQPTNPPGQFQVLPPDPTAGERPAKEARLDLDQTTRKFFRSAQRNIGKSILDNAAEEIRVLRDQSSPAVGLNAARLMLNSANGEVRREAGPAELSSSADLFYTYGKYSEDRGNSIDHGIYVTIWRININGDWKLIFDLQKKVEDMN